MMWDLETLRLLFWAMLGLVMMLTALNEGVALGVLSLLPALAEAEREQKALRECLAPTGLANLAWVIGFVMLLFAAWPIAYAIALASFYPVLLLWLLAVLLRPLGLYFLEEFAEPSWRKYAVRALFFSGWVPAVLLGVLAGNLLKGIPFHLDSDMHIRFLGDFAGLFNPFSLLVAATALALFAMHGALFVQLKIQGELRERAQSMAIKAGVSFVILFALTGLWIMHLEGYHVTSEIMPNAASNPLAKFVKRSEGLWLDNYEHLPVLALIPGLAFVSAIAGIWLSRQNKAYWAMLASTLCLGLVVLTFGVSLFPFLLPSNISLNSSLTIWDGSASLPALQILLWATVVAVPVMALLSRWLWGWTVVTAVVAEEPVCVMPEGDD